MWSRLFVRTLWHFWTQQDPYMLVAKIVFSFISSTNLQESCLFMTLTDDLSSSLDSSKWLFPFFQSRKKRNMAGNNLDKSTVHNRVNLGTHKTNYNAHSHSISHGFGLWHVIGVPGESAHMENMQTPHSKAGIRTRETSESKEKLFKMNDFTDIVWMTISHVHLTTLVGKICILQLICHMH